MKSIEENYKAIRQLIPFIIRCAVCGKDFNLRDVKQAMAHDHSIFRQKTIPESTTS